MNNSPLKFKNRVKSAKNRSYAIFYPKYIEKTAFFSINNRFYQF